MRQQYLKNQSKLTKAQKEIELFIEQFVFYYTFQQTKDLKIVNVEKGAD